ncbi:MAG: hypothetical protein WCN97_09985 [Thermoleophilia bacterium]
MVLNGSRVVVVVALLALGVGLAACGGSSSSSSSSEEAAPAADTAAAAPALTEYEQFAVDLINDPTNGFAPGFKQLTGNDAPAVPADIQCMVTTSDTDETQAQVMLWSGTGSDYSVVIVLTNGLELMNSSTSSYGTLFGSTTSEQEFPPPTTGTPCVVASDWTVSV